MNKSIYNKLLLPYLTTPPSQVVLFLVRTHETRSLHARIVWLYSLYSIWWWQFQNYRYSLKKSVGIRCYWASWNSCGGLSYIGWRLEAFQSDFLFALEIQFNSIQDLSLEIFFLQLIRLSMMPINRNGCNHCKKSILVFWLKKNYSFYWSHLYKSTFVCVQFLESSENS